MDSRTSRAENFQCFLELLPEETVLPFGGIKCGKQACSIKNLKSNNEKYM